MKVWQYHKRYSEAKDAKTFDDSVPVEVAVKQMAWERPNEDPCTWVVRFADGHLELWRTTPTMVIETKLEQAIEEENLYWH